MAQIDIHVDKSTTIDEINLQLGEVGDNDHIIIHIKSKGSYILSMNDILSNMAPECRFKRPDGIDESLF